MGCILLLPHVCYVPFKPSTLLTVIVEDFSYAHLIGEILVKAHVTKDFLFLMFLRFFGSRAKHFIYFFNLSLDSTLFGTHVPVVQTHFLLRHVI